MNQWAIHISSDKAYPEYLKDIARFAGKDKHLGVLLEGVGVAHKGDPAIRGSFEQQKRGSTWSGMN